MGANSTVDIVLTHHADLWRAFDHVEGDTVHLEWVKTQISNHMIMIAKAAGYSHDTACFMVRKLLGKDLTNTNQQIVMWLGFWRDHLPPEAVTALQAIIEKERQ